MGKESACNLGDPGDTGQSLGWEDPLEKAGQPTLVLLPGESHGQMSLPVTVHGVAKSQT